jgi:hypothetical protein
MTFNLKRCHDMRGCVDKVFSPRPVHNRSSSVGMIRAALIVTAVVAIGAMVPQTARAEHSGHGGGGHGGGGGHRGGGHGGGGWGGGGWGVVGGALAGAAIIGATNPYYYPYYNPYGYSYPYYGGGYAPNYPYSYGY